ncbi:MAG TPA: NAD(+)--dinitrogen-reductase ADP-D-ribosyltransferase [Methylococcus sp.]|nr:NAD(+)--dinitrogen-reductase ADP-D-ribosyltransferase [Methylococcus sp.]
MGIPTGLLASAAFNAHPLPLHISGVRELNPALFIRLAHCTDLREAAAVFQDYLCVLFGLNGEQRAGIDGDGRRRFRSSYLKLLEGWGFDSNGPQGAVLKGWVESRFGLLPTFHKEPLTRFPSPAWIAYIEEKMSSRFHNNSINVQLDLLYEFCQWALTRFRTPAVRHITLYRGENRFDEHRLSGPRDGRWLNVRLNNLVSFTPRREIADEFGDIILEVEVPVVKILFFNELLPRHPLQGEAEYLVIGGEYRVKACYY